MSKEDKNKIEQIDQLIRLEATGNAKELGEKIGVCERTALYLIKKMKEEYNAPIILNSYRNSYIYTTPGRIILGFKSNIKEGDMNKIKGGYKFIFKKDFPPQNSCGGMI